MNSTPSAHLAQGNILLFDGGMGTYYAQLCRRISADCEQANLTDPELVGRIHTEYIAAGCRAIKTNTFGANLQNLQGDEEKLRALVKAGWDIAQKAAGEKAWVFADIGPVTGLVENKTAAEYIRIAELFLEKGASCFLFETNSSDAGLAAAAEYIKQKNSDAFILVSFAVGPDGYTREGLYYKRLLKQMEDCGNVDAVGLNCISSARQLKELVQGINCGLPLAVMPNAGYPVVLNNRTFYGGDPAYFAQNLSDIAAAGVSILGGCCGTTPDHLSRLALLLGSNEKILPKKVQRPEMRAKNIGDSRFWKKLSGNKRVFAVELDPPKNADADGFMEKAALLQAAGADIITIADCPIARARMDSCLLACKIYRELGMEALPHMTCRDRNLNATKALLLGLYAEGIRNVLTVTGDPVPTAERDEVKSVYQFNSRKMARFINTLNEEELPAPLHIFGALNLNAINFDVQLNLAKQKMENGMVGFLTQPVLTEQALINLRRARAELSDAYILGGIMPVVSERNAVYMDSEVNGIRVAPQIVDLYKGKDRQEGEALAVKISVEIANQMADSVNGFYLMTPFGRAELICRIMEQIKDL